MGPPLTSSHDTASEPLLCLGLSQTQKAGLNNEEPSRTSGQPKLHLLSLHQTLAPSAGPVNMSCDSGS